MSVAQLAERLAAARGDTRAAALAEAELRLEAFAHPRPTMVHDAQPRPSDPVGKVAELLRAAAEEMERAGSFELAYATVTGACRLTAGADYVSASLATLHLGRVARQMNDYAVAKDCYDTMLSVALREQDGPLAARGHIGLALLHDMKGNLPAAEAEYKRALRMATPMRGAFASASQGLMSLALTRGQLADALLYGWNVYDASADDTEVRAGVLGELSSVALSAGFYEAALKGYLFASSLSNVPRLHVVVASGVIRAAARLHEMVLMRRYDVRLLDDIARANQPHTAAMCLLFAAEGWVFVQDFTTARERLDHGRALAEQFGYFEYVFRADAIARSMEETTSSVGYATSSADGFDAELPKGVVSRALRHGIGRLLTVGT